MGLVVHFKGGEKEGGGRRPVLGYIQMNDADECRFALQKSVRYRNFMVDRERMSAQGILPERRQ